MNNTTSETLVPVKIFYFLSLVPILTLLLLSSTWVVYFLSSLRFYRRKIRELQDNNGSFYGNLIHTKIELRKSILIIFILSFDIIGFFCMLVSNSTFLYDSRSDLHTNSSCQMSMIDSYRYHSYLYRFFHGLIYSSIYGSHGLVALLLLYLSQAYGYQSRFKHEKVYFAIYIAIQTTCVFFIKLFRATFFTVSFLLFFFTLISTMFFWEYSRRMSLVLKWRCDDARFESKEILNITHRMRRRYSRTSALLKALQIVMLVYIFFNDFSWQIIVYIGESCIVSEITGVDINFQIFKVISSSKAWIIFETFNAYVCYSSVGVFMLFYISLYLMIFLFYLKKFYPRYFGKIKYSGYSNLNQPLVGKQIVVYD